MENYENIIENYGKLKKNITKYLCCLHFSKTAK